jgi:UDP-glucose 4-epimerase
MVDLLVEKGLKVIVLDNLSGGNLNNIANHAGNKDVIFEKVDLRSLDHGSNIFNDLKYVFHFAGIGDIVPSIERPRDYMAVNVMGTLNLLEACRSVPPRKFVYAASSSCYGLAQTPTDEGHAISTLYPYALSKFQGEQIALNWHRIYGIPVNSIRIFNAYGTRSRTSGAYGAVFGTFLKQKLEGKPFTVVGDGRQRRDFLYVTDVVNGFWRAAEADFVGESWNLGAGFPQSINRLVELLGGDVIHIPKRPGEPNCTWADISKIKQQLGWEPRVTFEEGVQLVLADIEYWSDAPLWDVQSIDKATKSWFQILGREVG